LKKEYENIFLLSDKTALPIAKRYLVECMAGAQVYADFAGAAIYDDKKTTVFLLSQDKTETGVNYVKNACVPFLQKKYNLRFDKIVLRSIGASAALVERLLAECNRLGGDAISLNHAQKYDEDVIGIVYDSNSPKMLVDDVIRLFAEGLGDTVYALNDVSLEEQLVTLLKLRNKKLSVAESFTGGGLARRITSVSGASAVYFEGINAYDERSKMKRLGVSEYNLRTAGAVSDQTAYEMALGLLNTGDCDIAIATTGLAGPKSDRSMLPVGLCYIAVGTKEKVYVYRYKFDGNRKEITEKGINYALFMAYKHLKNM
jgi:nicotinamide-nucleotide amidase